MLAGKINFTWTRGALERAADPRFFSAAGHILRDGDPLRLRGVLGSVGLLEGKWVFRAERHAMDCNALEEHLGDAVMIPVG